MTTFKNFNDTTGEAIELVYVRQMRNADFAARFPGVKGFKVDSFTRLIGFAAGRTMDNQALPVTRQIEYKAHPSKHVCNAKCMGGKVNGSCECQCGGKNHGAGMFTSLIAA